MADTPPKPEPEEGAPQEAPTQEPSGSVARVVHKKPQLFWRNPLSYLFYLWYGPLLRLGYRRTLQYEDIFDIPDAIFTDRVLPPFTATWQRLVKASEEDGAQGAERLKAAAEGRTARFLLRTIWSSHSRRIFFALCFQLCYTAVQFAGPLMLSRIVNYLTIPEDQVTGNDRLRVYMYAMVMLLAPLVGTTLAGQSNRLSIGTQLMIRSQLTATIYRKALRLSTRAKQQAETGRIVNLMSADVNQLMMFFYPFANQLVTGPAMLIAALVLLWFQISWATFLGLAVLLLSTPATSIFMKKITTLRRGMLRQTDQRIKLMNQLLVGIRVLKMYAWEAAQEAAVLEVRSRELGQLRRMIPMRVGMQTLLYAAPIFSMVVCFAVYGSVEPQNFTASNIFTSIALFGLMRFPLIFLPFALIQFANALVSMRRLSQYLLLEERKEVVGSLDTPGIEIEGGEFVWTEPPKSSSAAPSAKTGKPDSKPGSPDGKPGSPAGKPADKVADANKAAPRRGLLGWLRPSRRTAAAAAAGSPADGSPTEGSPTEGSPPSTPPAAAGADGTVAVELSGMEAGDGDEAVADQPATPGTPGGKGSFWLRGVNVRVGPGELVCVVGRVGSGKSSLVQAVLGEMEAAAGTVKVGGSLAYAAQQAWVVNATVKENVAFGAPLDEARWRHAVDCCCLAADLEVLPAGADTEIGEKGINLSGGQKQRISLARALYQDADVYVLDDPLSAVDVHVGRHIFDRFINGAIRDKARLLVTNQLQYCPAADRVVVLDAGAVVAQGTYDECLANETFARLVSEHHADFEAAEAAEAEAQKAAAGKSDDESDGESDAKHQKGKSGKEEAEEEQSTDEGVGGQKEAAGKPPLMRGDTEAVLARERLDAVALAPGALGNQAGRDAALARAGTFISGGGKGASPVPDDATYGKKLARFGTMIRVTEELRAGKKGKGGKVDSRGKPSAMELARSQTIRGGPGGLVTKEDQETGHVVGNVYGKYIVAYGLLSFVSLIVLWSAEQAMRILTNWYLSKWTGAEMLRYSVPGYTVDRAQYIGGYVGFALGFACLTFMRSMTNLLSALRASRLLHARTLRTLVRAPVSFFDTTPVGRILNRFSKDMDDVDFLLSMSMTEFGSCMFQLLSTLIFLAVIQPWILAGIAPLGVIYWLVQRFYRRSYIELQRLDSVSRSPIYSHFSESLAGTETIRAYGQAGRFAGMSDSFVDANHRAYFSCRMANEWLSLRLDILGASIVYLTAMLAIYNKDNISASLLALTLSEALDVTLFLKSAVTSGAMFETRFNAVERLVAYWDLPQEAPAHLPDVAPPEDWPVDGEVVYEDVWMRYRPELEPVLKGVSFAVRPGEKVGIAGRTGSGKSSLIVALFRIVEPCGGRVLLDGLDILTLGLEDVRSRVAVIPQDPVLFSGTVRTNLDPYGRHSDSELWEALSHVALRELVSGLEEGLSARVAEGGDNFSVGQRQLLCVARALLRQPRVLVADEATASVDSETDALIQRTIRREFKHCTVLTIAHRLNTILDSTKVLVMEEGRVKEFDTVPALMGLRTGTFRGMVVEAGLPTTLSSRPASTTSLSALGESPREEGAPRAAPMGAATFTRRLKEQFDLE